MRKKELNEKYQALLDEREDMMAYIRRLERERYHLRSLMMIEALDEWFADEEEPDEETGFTPAAEVKVRGFAPLDNNGIK